jgi:hypothetical protein
MKVIIMHSLNYHTVIAKLKNLKFKLIVPSLHDTYNKNKLFENHILRKTFFRKYFTPFNMLILIIIYWLISKLL